MKTTYSRMKQVVEDVYALLYNEQYDQLAQLTKSTRLSSKEMTLSISEYDCQLTPYPNDVTLDVIEVQDSNPKEWNVIAPIYTKEEGLSDLSLELTLIEKVGEIFEIKLDNIHVR